MSSINGLNKQIQIKCNVSKKLCEHFTVHSRQEKKKKSILCLTLMSELKCLCQCVMSDVKRSIASWHF